MCSLQCTEHAGFQHGHIHVQGLIQEFSAGGGGGGPGCVQFVHAMMSLHTIFCENSVSRIGDWIASRVHVANHTSWIIIGLLTYTLITTTRKSLYLCMYVCMCVWAIRCPCAHHAWALACASTCVPCANFKYSSLKLLQESWKLVSGAEQPKGCSENRDKGRIIRRHVQSD